MPFGNSICVSGRPGDDLSHRSNYLSPEHYCIVCSACFLQRHQHQHTSQQYYICIYIRITRYDHAIQVPHRSSNRFIGDNLRKHMVQKLTSWYFDSSDKKIYSCVMERMRTDMLVLTSAGSLASIFRVMFSSLPSHDTDHARTHDQNA